MNTKLFKELCELPGISGYEKKIREVVYRELKGRCKLKTDVMGNVIAKVTAKNKGPKVMFAAHMDEVGLLVKHIEKQGVLRFVKIGGIDDRILLDQQVAIHTKKGVVHGVISSKPPHLQKKEEKKKVIKYQDLFIDVGAKDKKEIKRMNIRKGDMVTFIPNFRKLTDKAFMGKAFDNRAGIYLLIEAVKKFKPKKGEFYFVFSTQEETGLKGARTAAFSIEPDFAIAVDTSVAGGVPGIEGRETDLELGKGPALTYVEASGRGTMVPQRMRKFLTGTAKEAKIPYQIEIIAGGMTDAAMIQLTREGILSGGISVPTRNIHSSAALCHKKDLDMSLRFIGEIIKKSDKLKK